VRWAFAAAAAVVALGAFGEPAPDAVFELSLSRGKLATASNTLRVRRAQRVELKWSSDRPIVLHLHGYDLEATVTPGSPASMAFTANVTGRFPISEHTRGKGHHRAVLYLEVHP
jgi:hypothetical protein